MLFVPVLASGLETRNPFQNRQEKNEFYFLAAIKIFLTKKRNARVRGKIKNGFSSRFSLATTDHYRSGTAAANCSD